MIKKILDAVSLLSLSVFFGVLGWYAIWGETPHAAGQLSVQSKILAWDAALVVFGVNWLTVRYTGAFAKRFPRVFGTLFGPKGVLLYGLIVVAGCLVIFRSIAAISSALRP